MTIAEELSPECKPDVSTNSLGLETAMKRYEKREENLYPLRINAKTMIYVPKEWCNEVYAEKYRMGKMAFR